MQAKKGDYICAGLDGKKLDRKVLAAMTRVPRHLFLPETTREFAYEDRALSIECGQTISQPYIVALMSQEAKISQGMRVLEVGTGSGYQAAVLAELGAEVYSLEIIPHLAERARETLAALGYSNIYLKEGDGWFGWPEEAPYNAILVTAVADRFSPFHLGQLAEDGRIIAPIKSKKGHVENLICLHKTAEKYLRKNLGQVRFVPLTGEGEAKADN